MAMIGNALASIPRKPLGVEEDDPLVAFPAAPPPQVSDPSQVDLKPVDVPDLQKPPGFFDRFLHPDASQPGGALGTLGAYLMASEGSPLQTLGAGIIDQRKQQREDSMAQYDRLVKLAQARKSMLPTYQNVEGAGLAQIPTDGSAPRIVLKAQPKPAEIPFGFSKDPVTGEITAAPGFLKPADKEAAADKRQNDREDRMDARSAASQAAMEARQAVTLKAIADRQSASRPQYGAGTIQDIAQRVIAGDPHATTGIGRNPVAMAQINNEVHRQLVDAGMNGNDLAAASATFAGQIAGQRAVGTRSANIGLAAEEASQTIPLARAASDALPRGNFVPWNKAVQMVQAGNSDPRLATYVATVNAARNAYTRAISPSGVPTVFSQQHADEQLGAATGPAATKAVLDTWEREIAASKKSVGIVRGQLANEMSSAGKRGLPSAAPVPLAQRGGAPALPPEIAAILAKHGAH